jgi:hypothetical protein
LALARAGRSLQHEVVAGQRATERYALTGVGVEQIEVFAWVYRALLDPEPAVVVAVGVDASLPGLLAIAGFLDGLFDVWVAVSGWGRSLVCRPVGVLLAIDRARLLRVEESPACSP